MESITVEHGKTTYVLYNLSIERANGLKNDSRKLAEYFTACLQTGSNICIQENDGNSSSMTTTENRELRKKFAFLCGFPNFIYAVKFDNHAWHYFEVPDSIINQHRFLPASMDSMVRRLDKVKTINVNLNEEQSKNYFVNGKFVFLNKQLKTCMELGDIEPSAYNTMKPSELKSSHLVFASGETNPLLFLNQFEKCIDVKTDKDKMYKIRHFADESHKAEFSRLSFTSDWQSVRSSFLQMYSLSFVANKKKEMDIDYDEYSTLRSFMERKLMSLSKFTTLPFLNQMEIALNELPIQISSLFIVNDKMTCKKSEILDYCDSIEEYVQTMRETAEVDETRDEEKSNYAERQSDHPESRMEIFNFIPIDVDHVDKAPESSRGRGGRGRGGRGRGGIGRQVEGAVKKRGRPLKKLKNFIEDSEESNFSFVNQIDNTSRSSWSEGQ